MPVTTPAYCSREDAQRSVDFADGITAQVTWATDRAIQSAARNIEGELHRLFWPEDTTRWFDFPNYQFAYPWRLWFDRNDCLCITDFSSGGVSIPLNSCFLEPVNRKPGFPFTYVELDRSGSATFGGNAPTPQHAIQITGTWGFTGDADQVATLPAALSSATATTVSVDDSSQIGVGDLLILGYQRGTPPFPADTLGHAGMVAPYLGERILVADKAAGPTGLTQSGPGCGSALSSDNQLAVSGSGSLTVGEVLLLDAEQVLVTATDGSGYVVSRAWNGTVLGDHSAAPVLAYRQLSVVRGYAGTGAQAIAWPSGTVVFKHRVPSLIRDLAIAESANRILQETSGYARTVGSAEAAVAAPGVALADLWDEARTEYGRKLRSRVI